MFSDQWQAGRHLQPVPYQGEAGLRGRQAIQPHISDSERGDPVQQRHQRDGRPVLGQRGDGGEAVGAAEAAGHHVPDDDVDLPF